MTIMLKRNLHHDLGECSGGELVEIKSNQLKNFKFDSAKKKLELPAQKNLLTNYFCFASLEAKREYKAPRVSPTIQKTDHGVLNTMRYAYVQSGSVRELSSTSAVTGLVLSRAESEADVESQTNGLNEVASNEVGTPNKMLQDPIYRPCAALRKKHNSNPDQSKVRPERINTTLRSSYFLHATTNELNEIQEKNNICTDADFGSARYAMRPVSVDSDRKISTSIKKVVVSSYFQGKTVQGKIQYCKNENQLDEAPCNNLAHLDETKSMSTTDEDNATGRNHQGPEILVDKQEKIAVKDGKTVDLDKYAFSRTPSSNNYLEEARKRRKVASIDNPEIENSGGNEFSTGSDTACETKTGEEKFGCNISHIGQYSEIAEKSLERFASVISSFKFTSNGSRASGLRPPLKDVKNTCNNRLSGSTDLSKFAYAPTKKAPTSRGM